MINYIKLIQIWNNSLKEYALIAARSNVFIRGDLFCPPDIKIKLMRHRDLAFRHWERNISIKGSLVLRANTVIIENLIEEISRVPTNNIHFLKDKGE